MAGLDDEAIGFQDTQSEAIPAARASAASAAPNDKVKTGLWATKSEGGWNANANTWDARGYTHPQNSGGQMAPPTSPELGHQQDFHDPNRAKSFSQMVKANSKTRRMKC